MSLHKLIQGMERDGRYIMESICDTSNIKSYYTKLQNRIQGSILYARPTNQVLLKDHCAASII